jgi:hypothetical protein
MDSSKLSPTGQVPMNRAAEDEQIVDMSLSEYELMDEPPSEEQPLSPSRTREQVTLRPGADRQGIDQQAVTWQGQVPEMEQEEPSHGQRWANVPTGQPVTSQARRPLPAQIAAPEGYGAPARRPETGRKKGRKPLRFALVVIGLLALAIGIYTQSFAKMSTALMGGSTHQTASTSQTTPATSTTKPKSTLTPTVTVKSTSLVPSDVTSGALILLNPGIVRQGTSMGVTGSGFDPGASVDLLIKQGAMDSGQAVGTVKTDKYGAFYDNLTVPQTLSSGSFSVVASERGSQKVSHATGIIAGGVPQLKLSAQVGKPGDLITVSASGFGPNETVKVYWNTTIGQPITTLQANGSGGIGQATVQVPFGATGVNSFMFVGAKSQSMVAATFDLLSLYPSVKLSSYAIQADNVLSFSGKGFGPGERVLVYVNSVNGQPVAVIQAAQNGSFSNAGGFVIPFALKGRQTLVFLGEQSRATVAVGWSVLPYTPSAQTSTYGGLPGTTISFYAMGFARSEIVHVYVGSTQNSPGTMVSCFRTNDKGNAVAAGSYVIPGTAQGKLSFKLVGMKSDGVATATMSVSAPPDAVQVPTQPPFTCPLDNSAS